MDFIWIQALFLGIVEGLTEFLPISSTGHLILLTEWMNFKGPKGKVFEVAIQLGAILAICWRYREKLWQVTLGLPSNAAARHFATNLLWAFLPAAIIGVLAHSYIKAYLFSPKVVAVMLIIGGIAILLTERFRPASVCQRVEDISARKAWLIGVFQCLAMIPGTSRSGATILGGLWLGLERKTAAEFSFFLAIPTMFAATLYDLYKNRALLEGNDWEVLGIGFFGAFLTALLVVRIAMALISRYGFAPFAYYRLILGTILLALLF